MTYQKKVPLDTAPSALRLIVCCLRAASAQEEGTHINALCRRGMDWDAFVRLANHHRVISPVYQNLKRFAENSIPEPVFSNFKNRFHQNARQVLAKTAELVRVVKRFEEEGIPVLPFKGPVLALQAYGDIGSRHVGDLDIMVSPEQALAAHEILVHEGYHRTHPDFELTPRLGLVYIRNTHHFGYLSKDQGIKVELHWRFGSNRLLFPLSFHEFWRDRQILKLGGVDVATLSLEHMMLLLCVHGSLHAWFRLFWLNDVARLVSNHWALFDWNGLMRHAARLGIARMVAGGVLLANLMLGSPLPAAVRAFAEKDKKVHRLAKMSRYLIYAPVRPVHKPLTWAYIYMKLNRSLLRNDMRYKLTYWLMVLNPSAYDNWQRFPLPDKLFPLYYVIRPLSWFFRWFIPGTDVYRKGPMGRRGQDEIP